MYGYNSTCNNYNDFSYSFSGDLLVDSPLPDSTLPVQPDSTLIIPNMTEYESVPALMMKQELCYNNNNNSSSGCSSYGGSPSSLTSYEAHMERSLSSHSLHKNFNGFNHNQPTQVTASDDSIPVRKAFSTGDLDRVNMVQQHQYYHRSESCLSNESSISIIECMNAKACKYTPEEKKERIEKYRSKRNHRNFNKKIKYVCRKTLADSRPRIRGRFAKNSDENEKADQMIEWNPTAADHLEEDDENWINFLDAFSANLIP